MTNIKIIKPDFIIEDKIDGNTILKTIEKYGRVSHKSEGSITTDSAKKFIQKLMGWGHESVLEHEKITCQDNLRPGYYSRNCQAQNCCLYPRIHEILQLFWRN